MPRPRHILSGLRVDPGQVLTGVTHLRPQERSELLSLMGLPQDAVFLEDVVRSVRRVGWGVAVRSPENVRWIYWAGDFKPVGDTEIPKSFYATAVWGDEKQGWSTTKEEQDFSTRDFRDKYVEKLNLMSKNTKRMWVVGRMLRDNHPRELVSLREWFETVGLSRKEFQVGLDVLSALKYAGRAPLAGRVPHDLYVIRGPRVTPLELVALE